MLRRQRDSPNGKRYARKGIGGGIEEAFGFSVAPLLARAYEFEAVAERVRSIAGRSGLRGNASHCTAGTSKS